MAEERGASILSKQQTAWNKRSDKRDRSIYSNNRRPHSALKRFFLFVLALIVLAGIGLTYAFYVEPALLFVRHQTLSFSTLPDSWDGRTIVFFSDVHVGPGFSPDRIERLVKKINKASPDLVLFGGDLMDSTTPIDKAFSGEVASLLASINAPLGKLAICGNHDNRLIAELRLARGMLEPGGFTLLINQSVVLDGLVIGGLDESYFGKPDFHKTFQNSPEDAFRIALMHQPDYLPTNEGLSYDLALSGHSHNGQVTFFGKPILKVYEGSQFPYGLYHLDGEKQLFVSSGLGTVGIHARFFAPPEIVVIELKKKVS